MGATDGQPGTLTFLFTDLEVSTRLWEDEPAEMRRALETHDEIVRGAIEAHHGDVVKGTGDGFHAAFAHPIDAVTAAVALQRHLFETEWPTSVDLRARAGVHTGDAQRRDGDYFGPTLNRAARLTAAAHGGQIVCSAATGELTRDRLPDDVRLIDLGEHRLRDLARTERVFQVTHPDLPRDFPDLRTIDTLPGNLPVQPNRFVGRDALVAELAAGLDDAAVATLTGPGGVGKTRLALQVAAAVQPDFADGAWFVDLTTVTEPEGVAAEILDTLDYLLADTEDAIEGLCSRLRRRRMLLILDNCEQVTTGVAVVAEAIARTAEGVRVLATSREGLGIAAEQVVPIPPLDTEPEGDAIRLFAMRARAARPNFTIDDTSRAAVIELCRRLDGIPLAIELAAARTRSLSPSQILERIDERFRMLTGGPRTAAERHQTLQAAVDWSYDLLSVDERRVLNRLSVFAGGFTLDAAESVASDEAIDEFAVLDHLDALVDKSLVVADDTRLGRRYRLLETIRQYATDRLAGTDDAGTIRAVHAAHYLERVRTLAPALCGPHETATTDELDADFDNLRLMLDWYLANRRADQVIDAIALLEPFLASGDHDRWAIAYLDRSLGAEVKVDAPHVAQAYTSRAWHKSHVGYGGVLGDLELARTAADGAGVALPFYALHAEATNAAMTGDGEDAYRLVETGSEIARQLGDTYWVANFRAAALIFRALAAPDDSGLADLVLAVEREVDAADSARVRQAFLTGAALASLMSDPEHALDLFEESLRLAAQLRIRFAMADTHFFISLLQLGRGNAATAADECRQALLGHVDVGNRRGFLMDLSGAAGIAVQAGELEPAATLLAGLRRARVELGAPGSSNEQFAEERLSRRVARALGDDALDARSPDLDTTIDVALDTLDGIARTMPSRS